MGIETNSDSPAKAALSVEAGAESGAQATAYPNDPGLASIIDAWERLPDTMKAGILAMVRAAGG